MPQSRRKAREAALQALYKIEIAKSPIAVAIDELREHSDLPPDLLAYAERLVRQVREQQARFDRQLMPLLHGYHYDRLAVVDKSVMRIAAYELFEEPSLAPAVIIDEAVEIARKYSTIESGAFVNGVLDALRKVSPKANWDPKLAPPEEEPAAPEAPIEVVEETILADSAEAKQLSRIGAWKLKSDPEK